MKPRLFVPLVLALAACSDGAGSGGGATRDGVLHLDPRLADGRSPAAVHSAARSLVWSWERGDDVEAAELLPWRLLNAEYGESQGWTGPVIVGTKWREGAGMVQAGITWVGKESPLAADDVNLVEVDLVVRSKSYATLRWRPNDKIPGHGRSTHEIHVNYQPSAKVQTLVFRPGGHEGWRGSLATLTLLPVKHGGQVFDLRALRLYSQGFTGGAEPSRDAGDGGLVGFAQDDRRVWPSDFDEPLFERFVVPRGARLVVSSALTGELHGLEKRVRFEVDVRRVGDEAWERRAAREVTPAVAPLDARWRRLSCDLSDLGGAEVEVRFVARCDGRDAGGAPRAAAFWATPMVLAERPADARPNVVVLTLDTLRTDATGPWGGTDLTPFLDRLAEDGLVFREAWSGSNSTLPSHASLLTGQHVPSHGVLDNRATLAADEATLAQAMRAAGYQTAAAVSAHHLEAGISGLGRGFDRYLEVRPRAPVDGKETLKGIEPWIAEWGEDDAQPFFLWVHLFDPHTPYGAPEAFLETYIAERGLTLPPKRVDPGAPGAIGPTPDTGPGMFLEGVTNEAYARFLYEAGVAYTDSLVERFWTALENAGFADDTLLVVLADHGEALGDHDVWYGHQMLYPPVMRVPLLIRMPPGSGPTGRVDARVSTVDVARTLLDVLGIEGLPEAHGENLLALAGENAQRVVHFVHSGNDQVGLRDGQRHFFVNVREYGHLGKDRREPDGKRYLYHYAEDAACVENLAPELEREAELLDELARKWLEAAWTGERVGARLSAEDEARLDALGYTEGEED